MRILFWVLEEEIRKMTQENGEKKDLFQAKGWIWVNLLFEMKMTQKFSIIVGLLNVLLSIDPKRLKIMGKRGKMTVFLGLRKSERVI